jgi:hypothetical protein
MFVDLQHAPNNVNQDHKNDHQERVVVEFKERKELISQVLHTTRNDRLHHSSRLNISGLNILYVPLVKL